MGKPLSPSVKIKISLVFIHFLMVPMLLGEFFKDHSNFYLVITSLILITFSLDLRIDTVRRNLMLISLRA